MKYVFLMFLFIVSCKNTSNPYTYEEGLNNYFEQFEIELDESNSKMLLISTTSCNSCVSKTFDLIINEEINPLAILLVGDTVNYSNLALIKELENKYSIYYDLKQNIRQYQTGFGNLLFLKYSSGKISDHIEINESNIDQFEKRLIK
jgi:hypothetical protein